MITNWWALVIIIMGNFMTIINGIIGVGFRTRQRKLLDNHFGTIATKFVAFFMGIMVTTFGIVWWYNPEFGTIV